MLFEQVSRCSVRDQPVATMADAAFVGMPTMVELVLGGGLSPAQTGRPLVSGNGIVDEEASDATSPMTRPSGVCKRHAANVKVGMNATVAKKTVAPSDDDEEEEEEEEEGVDSDDGDTVAKRPLAATATVLEKPAADTGKDRVKLRKFTKLYEAAKHGDPNAMAD